MAHYREMLSQNNSCMHILAVNATGTQFQQRCLFCHPPPPRESTPDYIYHGLSFCYLHFICQEIMILCFSFPPQGFFVPEFLRLLIPCSQSLYIFLRARAHTGDLLCRVFPSRSEPAILHHRDWKKPYCTKFGTIPLP